MSTMQLSFTGDSAGLEVVAVVVAMFVLVSSDYHQLISRRCHGMTMQAAQMWANTQG